MIGKRLINTGVAAADALVPSENFNTVLYTGNGSTQRIGGYINRGAEFNGSSSYITLPNSTEGIGEVDSSFSFWVYPVSVSSGYEIVALLTNNDWVEIRYNSSGQFQIYPARQSNGTYVSLTAVTKAANNWYNIVITRDSATSTIKLYIDGSLVETNTSWDGTLTSSSDPNGLGANVYSNTLHFSGKLDQIRFFNKALSSSEVTTLYGETHASTTISTTDIFDDNSGVALYQLDGNANDTGGVSGKFGSAAHFNGSSSYITLGATNQFASGTVSISFWVNPATISTNYVLLGNGNGGSFADGDNDIFLRSDGYIGYELGQSSSIYEAKYSTTTQLTANTWNHITLTYDSSLGTNITQVYVNGVQQSLSATYAAGGTFSGDIFIGTLDYHIGKRNLSTLFFDGKIDDVRIYSDVLTSTEVGYLYNNTTASIPTDNLLAYYKLDGDARDEQQLYDGTATNVSYAYDGTATNVTYQEATSFQPDLVWIKSRNFVRDHALFDSVRGTDKILEANLTDAEFDGTGTSYLSSFDSNGFTVLNGANNNRTNGNYDYAAWCFKGGGTAVSNTDGSITSSVSANQDAGFSIVSYAGNNGSSATIGHGLNSAPELVIIKARNLAAGWPTLAAPNGTIVYTRRLNDTGATDSSLGSVFFNSTAPTSSVFTVGGSDEVNDGYNYIAYCFHSVDGYSKIGTYTSDGSDGDVFVETNFEPAFLMIKNTSASFDWVIFDNKRDTANLRDSKLSPNTSSAEYSATSIGVDFTSDGFVVRGTDDAINHSSSTFIYLAIAADPDTTTPTVENSFDVVTYTGNGSTQKISTDFKPDLVWIKGRVQAQHSGVFDSVRGADLWLRSGTTDAENNFGGGYGVTSFDSNGFTIGSGSAINNNGDGNVAWCWKAGDHDDNLPQINTEGSVDSVVSVNADAGFSIVKYTGNGGSGQSVGHGLSSAPEMVIFKRTDAAQNWFVFVKVGGVYKRFEGLNTTAAATSVSSFSASSTSITWSGTTADFNGSSREYIMYCFHSVSGYQKIGSFSYSVGYSENVGFEPRFLLMKKTSSTGSWYMIDNKRVSGSNNYGILANSAAAEDTGTDYITFTSTGFTTTYSDSGTYIYLAIK